MKSENHFWSKPRRLKELPPYLFVEIDRMKKMLIQEGKDIIDLGIGDPDLASPKEVIEELCRTVENPENHHYPLDSGVRDLRYKIRDWMEERFHVDLDAEGEILPLLGSKEGIAHFPLAFIEPQDYVLIPEPLYPPYRSGAIFAGARIIYLSLKEENGFIPEIKKIDTDILNKIKLLYLNYPNNPTTAVVDKGFLAEVVELAKLYKFCIIYDAAYSEITFNGYQAPSILEIKGAKEVAIEFHSFSKTYSMTGWRIGWACGNRVLVDNLRQLKSNIDSGIFNPVQYAAAKALEIYPQYISKIRNIYQGRRDIFISGLKKAGWQVSLPQATFYIWVKVPANKSSQEFCKDLLERAYIIATPGIGFGPSGEGYIRFSLTTGKERLQEAISRIQKL